MKLIKSKKGMVLYYLVIFGFMAALTVYLVNSLWVKPAQQQGFPGEFQLSFLEEAAKLEGQLFYFELAAKESAGETAINLASLGGFKNPLEGFKCGVYGAYYFWNNKTDYCWPDYKSGFLNDFGNRFEENANKTVYGINYDYFVRGNLIAGEADDTIYSNVFGPQKIIGDTKLVSGVTGRYEIRPSFSVEMSYNIDEYQDLFEYARELVVGCTEEDESCVDHKLSEFNAESDLKWQKGDCETGILYDAGEGKRVFCVNSTVLRVYDGEKYVDRKVQYKFGLNLAGEKELLT